MFFNKSGIKVSSTHGLLTHRYIKLQSGLLVFAHNISYLEEAGGYKVQGLSRLLSKLQACLEKLERTYFEI